MSGSDKNPLADFSDAQLREELKRRLEERRYREDTSKRAASDAENARRAVRNWQIWAAVKGGEKVSEVSVAFGVSRTRVHQVCAKCNRIIRHPARRQLLGPPA